MPAVFEMGVCSALALTTLLISAERDPLSRWDRANRATEKATWLPWAVIVVLATTSTGFMITHPLDVAQAFAQGTPQPNSPLIVATGP